MSSESADPAGDESLADAIGAVARRLRDLLAETHAVPRKLAGEVREAVEHLLQVIEEKEEAA